MENLLEDLSEREIRFFIKNGFIVKRKILGPELCAIARDRLWAGNTSASLKRKELETWIKGISQADRVSTSDGVYDRSKQYSWRLRELSGDEDMLKLLPLRVFSWFEQLLGENEIVEPEITSSVRDPDPRECRLRGWPVWGGKELRGIYCVLPEKRVPSSPSLRQSALAGAHIDPEPVHLVVSGYIDRVPEDGGGIAVFPESHRLLYEADPQSADIACHSILHPPHTETGAAEFVLPQPKGLKDSLNDIESYEFFGEEGDVILWHGRIFHSATPNYSDPPQIRQMVTYDAYKKSVYNRAFEGHYKKLVRPSPPPNVRKDHGMKLSPALDPPEPRQEGKGLWDDWSETVRRLATTDLEELTK